MINDLVIIGAGDFAREVVALVERINTGGIKWNLLGYVDDNTDLIGQTVEGYKVLGSIDWIESNNREDLYFVSAIGISSGRATVTSRLNSIQNLNYAILIDPSAILMHGVSVGCGSIICAGTIVAINVKIGPHSIINLNCTLGHDTVTGAYFTAHPGTNISGKVRCGDKVYCGTGVRIIQGIEITNDVLIGAGAVVINDIDREGTYVGVPAKRIKQ